MATPRRDVPALTAAQVQGGMLCANRRDLVRALSLPQCGAVAELGVGLGDFSEFLLTTLAPRLFVGIDTFILHTLPAVWGRSTAEIFGGATHLAHYRARFAALGDRVQAVRAQSHEGLAGFADASFDLIYIDAGHTESEVQADTDVAVRKLSPGGTLMFNDYTMFNHLGGHPYGVVPVVNALVAGGGWRVAGFALHPQMFCDIALRRV